MILFIILFSFYLRFQTLFFQLFFAYLWHLIVIFQWKYLTFEKFWGYKGLGSHTTFNISSHWVLEIVIAFFQYFEIFIKLWATVILGFDEVLNIFEFILNVSQSLLCVLKLIYLFLLFFYNRSWSFHLPLKDFFILWERIETI